MGTYDPPCSPQKLEGKTKTIEQEIKGMDNTTVMRILKEKFGVKSLVNEALPVSPEPNVENERNCVTNRSIREYKQLSGVQPKGDHEGPLWHSKHDNIHYTAAAFADGMEAVSGHEARRIARRAGLSKRCAIFGDCECPGVYLILHRNFVEKGQDTLGYTVTWDDRFFEVEEKKAKVHVTSYAQYGRYCRRVAKHRIETTSA